MATYGAFLSAPLSHFFTGFFQRIFRNRTGLGARLGMILAMQVIQVCFLIDFSANVSMADLTT